MRTQQRWTVLILLGVLCIGLLMTQAAPVLAAEKSIVWDAFDVDIQVNANGAFDVTERQAIRFMGGDFTFGYRSIPKDRLGYIDNWAVTDASGNVYTQASSGVAPYTFVVSDTGGDYGIRWYFPATDEPETYTLQYTVHDGLRYYPDGDQLWWKAVYGDRSYPVLSSRVRVLLPNPAVAQQYQAYINGADARGSVTAQLLDDGRAVIFDAARRLNAGEELEVRVEFTPDVVVGSAPSWQQGADAAAARQAEQQAYLDQWGPVASVGLGALGLLLFFGGPLGERFGPNLVTVRFREIGHSIPGVEEERRRRNDVFEERQAGLDLADRAERRTGAIECHQ